MSLWSNRTARIALVAAGLVAALAAMVASHAVRRASGTEIRLEMTPVDPRDLLLGHYVVIDTPLHELDTAELGAQDAEFARGDPVFVRLVEDAAEGVWRPEAMARERAALGSGLIVQGRVRDAYEIRDYAEARLEPADPDKPESGPRMVQEPVPGSERLLVRAVWNIERYYAEKEAALALEDMREAGRLQLIVSAGGDGALVIKGLVIDGEARYDTLF